VRYQFEDFVLDPERRELRRGSQPIETGPQVFDVLLHLVRHREHVVTKDNLIDAVWGGRIVSESTLTSHINAVRRALSDTGEEQRLIRTIPKKGYRFVSLVQEADPSEVNGRTAPAKYNCLAVPDRPSIAVLPFVNLSGDPQQDYFVDGIVDDIISALSHKRWLFVIARNSSFTYKGRAVDVKQVGRELGVRYVLEGSLRAATNMIRITGQLVDAGTGATLWSERFDSAANDLFELQDQLTARVVGALAPNLEGAEIERSRHKPTESLDAYDYYLRGVWTFRKDSRNAIAAAQPLFYEAIQRDPEFASAYAMAAGCYSWRKLSRWLTNPEEEVAEGTRLARQAVELGQNDAVALAAGAHALAHLARDIDSSVAILDRALTLDPNLAVAWYLGGFVRIWRGQPDDGINHLARAMRLNPLSSDMHRMEVGTAMAHFLAGRTEDALTWAEKAARHLPDRVLPIIILAAIYARAGCGNESKTLVQRLHQLEQAPRISDLKEWLPFQRSQDLGIFVDALSEAGLPNGPEGVQS
jgi:TolB-like protein